MLKYAHYHLVPAYTHTDAGARLSVISKHADSWLFKCLFELVKIRTQYGIYFLYVSYLLLSSFKLKRVRARRTYARALKEESENLLARAYTHTRSRSRTVFSLVSCKYTVREIKFRFWGRMKIMNCRHASIYWTSELQRSRTKKQQQQALACVWTRFDFLCLGTYLVLIYACLHACACV